MGAAARVPAVVGAAGGRDRPPGCLVQHRVEAARGDDRAWTRRATLHGNRSSREIDARLRLPARQQQVGGGAIVARQHHVAACSERRPGAGDDIACAQSTRHAEIVGKDHAVEAQAAAQDVLQPVARIAGRLRVDLRIDDVRRHHALEALPAQHREGDEIVGKDLGEAARVHRQVGVRVGGHVAVAGKVLAHGRHASGTQPVVQRGGEVRRGIRIAVEGAIADDGAGPVIEVQHRRETEVHALRAKLCADGPAQARRLVRPGRHVAVPHLAQRAHRRNRREPFAKTLDATAFVIDCDQEPRRAQ